MSSNLTNKKFFPALLPGLVLCAAILLGTFFRFYNIDKKIYWRDEIFTTIYVSGHTEKEVTEDVYNGKVISAPALEKYIESDPEKNFFDILRNLTLIPEHTPLYYLSAKLWTDAFGFSMRNLRLLAAVISLLIFPCVYWLCRELFESKLAGFIAMVLVAVSPIHLIFAQEAREYSLWTVMILLSSAAFLRAKRINTKPGWVLYAFTIAAGLYTHWLFFLVVIAHGLYMVILEGMRWNKTIRRYFISSLSGIFTFAPWICILFINLSRVATLPAWRNIKFPMPIMLRRWLIGFTRIFCDVTWEKSAAGLILNGIIVIVLIWSIYFVIRKAAKKISILIMAIAGLNLLFLIAPDLVFGGIRSIIPRYLIPCYLMVQLTAVYFFAEHITPNFVNMWQRKLCRLIFVLVLFMGVLSCTVISGAKVWWNKYDGIENPLFAEIINVSRKPLVVSDAPIDLTLSLAYLLEPKTHFQLVTGSKVPEIPEGYSDIFLFWPSGDMISAFKNDPDLTVQEIGWIGSFWKVKRNE